MSRRSTTGCWTCRVRRKRCDEKRPVCENCYSLRVACNYSVEKPEWMDGGAKQDAMALQIKHEIKAQAPFRRRPENTSPPKTVTPDADALPASYAEPGTTYPSADGEKEKQAAVLRNLVRMIRPLTQTDSLLLKYFIDNVFPFLYPFYQPSPLSGGKAWITDLAASSPVFQNAVLCQSSYYFALVRGTTDEQFKRELLTKTNDTLAVLQAAIEVMKVGDMLGHIRGAVRVLSAIIQVQRFEVAALRFQNCYSHLNAAIAVFEMIVEAVGGPNAAITPQITQAIIGLLGPSPWRFEDNGNTVLNSEQSAFHFSTALLLFDDIISSTVMQTRPRLQNIHHALLDGPTPIIDMAAVIGCQNWAMVHIGEIAALDAWKQECKRNGTFDALELAQRATEMKSRLAARMLALEIRPDTVTQDTRVFHPLGDVPTDHSLRSSMMTRIWAHAAWLYLSMVVSGAQPASPSVRHHISRIAEQLNHEPKNISVIRSLVWPICITGSMASRAQGEKLKEMIDLLQPMGCEGPLRQAVIIMDRMWQHTEAGIPVEFHDLFQNKDELVLLV